MKDMILFPEDIERLNSVLSQLVLKANLLLSVLINKDGRLLTSQGCLDQVDTVSMAALVAGNSASTLAIANLMGEREFSTMYHQGKDKHIYIAAVDENTFIALVFDDRTNIDRVKVFARQFDRQLKHTLFQVYNKSEDMVNLDLDMDYTQYNNAVQSSMSAAAAAAQSQPPMDYYAPPQQPPYLAGNPSQQPGAANFNNSDSSVYFQEQLKEKTKKDDDEVFYIEPQKNVSKTPEPNDTNYLFLKNKIRESIKRKNEEI